MEYWQIVSKFNSTDAYSERFGDGSVFKLFDSEHSACIWIDNTERGWKEYWKIVRVTVNPEW